MVLDVGGVFVAIGLGIAGFVIVLIVCVVILRLITVVLPPRDGGPGSGEGTPPEAEA